MTPRAEWHSQSIFRKHRLTSVTLFCSYRRQVAHASYARLDTLFPTFHPLSYIFQTTRWTLGGDWFWQEKFAGKYAKYGSDIITITSFFSPTAEFVVANASAIRKLNLDRQTFRSEFILLRDSSFGQTSSAWLPTIQLKSRPGCTGPSTSLDRTW